MTDEEALNKLEVNNNEDDLLDLKLLGNVTKKDSLRSGKRNGNQDSNSSTGSTSENEQIVLKKSVNDNF